MRDLCFFDNVFDPDFCRFLLANARAELASGRGFRRSNFHWEESIRKSSAVVLVRDYDEILSKLILGKLIERGIIADDRYSVMNYAWTRLSYIPWHDDQHRDRAVTIYLNDVWELDWGGLFLYRDADGEIRAKPPVFNHGLRNGGNILHSTTPVGLDAPEPRFTLQLFSKAADSDSLEESAANA